MIVLAISVALNLIAAAAVIRARRTFHRARADKDAATATLTEARALIRQTAAHRMVRSHMREN